MKEDFYIYGHYDYRGILRYIGKGKDGRAWSKQSRNSIWHRVFSDYFPEVRLLHSNLSEDDAFKLEKDIIARERETNTRIINICDGGIGGRSGERHWFYGKKRDAGTIAKLMEGKNKWIAENGHPRLGAKLSEEHKAKFFEKSFTPIAIEKRRIQMLGRVLTDEHKAKIGVASKNADRTLEWNKAISEGKKGKPNGLDGRVMPEEQRRKISEARRNSNIVKASGVKIWDARRKNGTGSGFTTAKAKKVRCKETGHIFRCATEAAKHVSGSDKHIQACCKGRRNTHKGLRWEYAECP